MRTIPLTPVDSASLVARLETHKALAGAPRAELEWIVANGELREYDAGDVMLPAGAPSVELVVVLSGRIVVRFGNITKRRHAAESKAGSVTGLLPYSRLTSPPSDVVTEEPTELIAIHRDRFPDLIRTCPVITERLVHTMLDRARRFAAVDWQDEKLASLGRLAAGLAHELNNPAAAAASGAKRLSEALAVVGAAAHAVGLAPFTDAQRAEVATLVHRCLAPRESREFTPLERADAEERVVDWLESRGADPALGAALVDANVDRDTLDQLSRTLEGSALDVALRWVATAASAQAVAHDVERATRRIHDLVSAVRGFTYMDRPAVPEPTDVAKGLADTVAVLTPKAKRRAASVRIEAPPDLPAIHAVGAELNQVWSNLIDNALDAAGEGGEVLVQATREGDFLVVRVIDNGPGIPADVQARMFDPFFTTKPVGEGTGLGLDIARRMVRAHGGEIDVETQPGRTEFRVSLPVSGAT